MIEVLLVAPYASVRAGLRVLLATDADMIVAGEAMDAPAFSEAFRTHPADAVLIDAGADVLADVVGALAEYDVAIVVLSDDPEDARLLASRRRRAWCALTRAAGGEEIAAGVRAAVSGIIALAPSLAADLWLEESASSQPTPDMDAGEPPLTPREREVLQLMTRGLANKNIASRLQISLSTAKFHVASILTKLDASSRTEAVTIGARRGLVSL